MDEILKEVRGKADLFDRLKGSDLKDGIDVRIKRLEKLDGRAMDNVRRTWLKEAATYCLLIKKLDEKMQKT